jgi:hypothetical protein
MTVDPFDRSVSGYDFMTPTDRGPHPGIDYGLSYEEIGLPFAVQVEQQGQLDQGIGGNELIGKIVGTPYEIILAHLDRFRRQVGDVVPAGADIAESGATGVASGPHLHLQILDDRKSGSTWAERSVDPRAVLQEVSAMSGSTIGKGGETSSNPCGLSDIQVGNAISLAGVGASYAEIAAKIGTSESCVTQIFGAEQKSPGSQITDAAGGAISGAVDRVFSAAPRALVAVGIVVTIGILAFGGVKRIAD